MEIEEGRYTVEKCDVADDPGRGGRWDVVAEGVTKAEAIELSRNLLGRGYDWNMSISVNKDGGFTADEIEADPRWIDAVFARDSRTAKQEEMGWR